MFLLVSTLLLAALAGLGCLVGHLFFQLSFRLLAEMSSVSIKKSLVLMSSIALATALCALSILSYLFVASILTGDSVVHALDMSRPVAHLIGSDVEKPLQTFRFWLFLASTSVSVLGLLLSYRWHRDRLAQIGVDW
ncbi:hypothetical protein HK107_12960 [Parvularcula sp. ZS-1/3]|uniref:Uncharacterized protein n=1 Tax=Parvularcula mediterranea TaxID=2732508 RepID=A0A7Y3RP77_9PROT|nr:hypothetical protein [Parvularcula mediterranea]NNU17235.1 hypothetical protein [Parvularcula mediterranea]